MFLVLDEQEEIKTPLSRSREHLLVMSKRTSPDEESTTLVGKELVVSKKQKVVEPTTPENALIAADLSEAGVKRTSGLTSPTMLLMGHTISPTGKILASGGYDRKLYIWQVYGTCKNHMLFEGHKGPILHVDWKVDGTLFVCDAVLICRYRQVFSSSADMFGAIWDIEEGVRVKKLRGHTAAVNSISPLRRGPPLVVTASDDRSAKIWDVRQRSAVKSFKNSSQVATAVFSDDGSQIFTAGIDEDIQVWDCRKGEIVTTLEGHRDMVTHMSLSPDGSYLLSNSMDNTLRIWDVRPFVKADRCVKLFDGHLHSYEKNLLKCNWSADGSKITAGSSDRFVYVWDTTTRQVIYKLPGHDGSVNETCFHPTEPIIASCGSDRKIYLGEFDNE